MDQMISDKSRETGKNGGGASAANPQQPSRDHRFPLGLTVGNFHQFLICVSKMKTICWPLLLHFQLVLADPRAKEVIRAMDERIKDHVAWNDWEQWGAIMSQFFTQDMIYDTNYYDASNTFMGNGTGIRSWYDREHIPINQAFDNQTFHQMIFAAEASAATTTTYAIAPWSKGPFFGIAAPNKMVRYRILDFYILKEDKIWYNWMLLDAVHLFYQAGYDVLPNNISPLRQGWSLPPKAMDGLPAPVSMAVTPQQSRIAKVR